MSLAAIASVTLGFVAAMMLVGSTALYPPEKYIFHQQRIHPAQYIKPTAIQRNGSQQTHTTLVEECDEPSVIPKADHLPHKFPNLS